VLLRCYVVSTILLIVASALILSISFIYVSCFSSLPLFPLGAMLVLALLSLVFLLFLNYEQLDLACGVLECKEHVAELPEITHLRRRLSSTRH